MVPKLDAEPHRAMQIHDGRIVGKWDDLYGLWTW